MRKFKFWYGIVMMAISLTCIGLIMFEQIEYNLLEAFGLAAIITFNLFGGMMHWLDNEKKPFNYEQTGTNHRIKNRL
jgi:undecaprenyl pyrophosphate phosphatase UppP